MQDLPGDRDRPGAFIPRAASRPGPILGGVPLVLAWLALVVPAAEAARPRSGWREASSRVLGGKVRAGAEGIRLASSLPSSTQRYLAEVQRRYHGPNAARFARYHPRFVRVLRVQDRIAAGRGLNAATLNGLLPTTAYWNLLRYRRSLDPARFDRENQRLGALLALDQQVREQVSRTASGPPPALGLDPAPLSPLGPPIGGTPGLFGNGGPAFTGDPTTPGGRPRLGFQPYVVPEPSGLVLAILGAAAIGLARAAAIARSRGGLLPRAGRIG